MRLPPELAQAIGDTTRSIRTWCLHVSRTCYRRRASCVIPVSILGTLSWNSARLKGWKEKRFPANMVNAIAMPEERNGETLFH